MTTELTKAAQQALEACPFCGCEPQDAHHIEYGRWAVTCRCGASGASANTGPNATDAAKIKAYSDARTAWNTRALTQRPAAQTYAPDKFCFTEADGSCSSKDPRCMHQPAAQTEREAFLLWWAGTGMTLFQDTAFTAWQARASLPAPQQATPEPVPADQAKWCKYVAGMVDCWVSAEWPHYNHMDEDRRVKAIAGIIERRLWAMPKPAHQQATPEPVGTVVAWLYTEDGETKFGHPQGHRPKDARPLVFGDVRPAPGVPEVRGVQWFAVAEHGLPDFDEEVIGGLWYTDPWLKPERATRFMWGLCRVVKDDHRDFKDGKRWQTFGPSHNDITHWARLNMPALAAAQAKGSDK